MNVIIPLIRAPNDIGSSSRDAGTFASRLKVSVTGIRIATTAVELITLPSTAATTISSAFELRNSVTGTGADLQDRRPRSLWHNEWRMTVIDLTHPISQDMPVYPGTDPPVIVTGCTVAEDGFLERKITLFSHTGTHIDAPAHLIEGGRSLDAFPVDHYYGPAVVVEATGEGSGTIGMSCLQPRLEDIARADFLLIRTAWSRFWGTDRYLSGYPVLSLDAAETLAGLGLKGVGLDAISADPIDSRGLPVHLALLRAEILIIENLTGLELLPESPFMFSCLPLAFQDADGSPVRAVAYLPPA